MQGDRTRILRFVPPLVVLGLLAWSPRVEAGPGTYDPKTRTFHLTYTYAVVPSLGMTNDQIDQLGAVQDVTSDQDAKVRALFSAVSDKLWQATDKRAKIGALDHVDSVKQADIIISPTGKVGRGGYATPGAIEDRQGHLVLFYEELADEQEVDEELTILHELSHYLFGLPDEYRDGEASGLCPLQNGGGPGCLMDNYLFNGPRHGWYGRFCQDDHNADAPNPMTILAQQSAQQSCRNLLDLFFQSRLKGDDALNPPPDDGTNQPTTDTPFTGVFKSLVEATSSFLLDMINDAADAKKPTPTAGALRTAAQKFLRDQVAKNRSAAGLNAPTADDIKRGVEAAVQTVQSSRIALPKRFDGTLLDQIKQKAQGIAVREIARRGRSTSAALPQLFTSAAARDKAVASLQKVIFAEIQKFAQGALNLNDTAMAPTDRKFSNAEKAYLNQVALDTAKSSLQDDNSEFSRFLQAARVHIRISQIIARNTLDAADDQGIVGTDLRRIALTDADRELEKLALKGNPFQPGFGLRRTLILAPYPIYTGTTGIRIQSTNTASYQDIRSAFIEEFGTLIGRERIVVLPEEMSPPLENVEGRDAAEKLRNILRQIDFTSDQVRRNRIDNVIVLAPPGGLPEDLGDQLELLRRRMALNPDVRLDIVLFGQGRIPRRLRDASLRSVGSVLTVSDIDEFGAVAQRLRGEGISGSWVIIPEQGRIELVTSAPGAKDAKAPKDEEDLPKLRLVPMDLHRSMLRAYTYAYPEWKAPDRNLLDVARLFRQQPTLPDTVGIFKDLETGRGEGQIGEKRLAEFTYAARSMIWIHDNLVHSLVPPEELEKQIKDDERKTLTAEVTKEYRNDPAKLREIHEDPKKLEDEVEKRLKAALTNKVVEERLRVARSKEVEDFVFPREVFKPYDPYSLLVVRAVWLNNCLRALEDDKFNTQIKAQKVQALLDRVNELIGELDRLEGALTKPRFEATDYHRAQQVFGIVVRAKQALARAIDPRIGAVLPRFRSSEDVFEGSAAARRALEAVIVQRGEFYKKARNWIAVRKDDEALEQPDFNAAFFDALGSRWDNVLWNLRNCDKFEVSSRRNGRPRAASAAGAGDLSDLFESNPDDKANYQDFLSLLAAIYVDLCNLEDELDRGLHVTRPFDRYPRDFKSIASRGAGAGQGKPGTADSGDRLKLEPDDPEPIVLDSFTAEEDAEFDIVVGFSRSLNVDAIKQDPPKFRLMDGASQTAQEHPTPYLQIDKDKTTETLLVYRLPNPSRTAGRLASGEYFPRLYLRDKHLPRRGGQIDYTFSVASRNPKVLLTASLRQIQLRDQDNDPENDAQVADRGIIVNSKNAAIIEALVTAGTSVQNVQVDGCFYQEIRAGGSKIESQKVSFQDDGIWPDTTKGDGVYTAKIVLQPQESRKKAEYRVFIQAKSTDKTTYVPPAENFGKPDKPRQDPDKKVDSSTKLEDKPVDTTTLPKVPKFQRATSVDFQVEGSD